MAPVLQELAGNGRGQQILAVTVVVLLSSVFSSGVSFWWSEQADQKLQQVETEAQNARRDLVVDLRRDISVLEQSFNYRLQVLDARLTRMDVTDTAIQDLVGRELRSLREEIGRRATIEDKNQQIRRRDEQLAEIARRITDLERMIYGRRGGPP